MQKQIIPMPAVLPAKSPNLGATDRYTISTSPEKANNCSPGLQTVLDQPPAAFPRQMLLLGLKRKSRVNKSIILAEQRFHVRV